MTDVKREAEELLFLKLFCSSFGLTEPVLYLEQDPITLEKMKANPKLTHFSDGLDYMTDILFPFSGDAKATTVGKLR